MISVILPVYNQHTSLMKVLNAFCMQNLDKNDAEFIIVDDGSTDGISKISSVECMEKSGFNYRIIHQRNCGRAVARNVGIKNSIGNILIFCDADRFPKYDFVEQHMKFHERGDSIVIGTSYDYFGRSIYASEESINWEMVKRLSRVPSYFKTISSIYDEKGYSSSGIVWLSFLVGNVSVNRNVMEAVGGFDEDFKEWGFEHFELAYRLWCSGFKFSLNREAINYHIPHPRTNNFYTQAIAKSAKMMVDKHSKINGEVLTKFVNGKIDIISAEKIMYKEKNNEQR